MLPLDRWLRVVPGTARANARIDLLAAALFGAFAGLTLPFIPVMGCRLGASPLGVSLLVASQAVVLLLSLGWARIFRSAHPVRLAVWPQVAGRSLFLLMPFVGTPAVYVALVVLYYGIASIASLGYAQVMRAVYPEDVRGRIMGVVRVGMALSWTPPQWWVAASCNRYLSSTSSPRPGSSASRQRLSSAAFSCRTVGRR